MQRQWLALHLHRFGRRPRRGVLLWLVLAWAVAWLSPLVQPTSLVLVCSGIGGVKIVLSDDGDIGDDPDPLSHGTGCPCCQWTTALPPAPRALLPIDPAEPARSISMHPRVVAAAAPLPSRGPPRSPGRA